MRIFTIRMLKAITGQDIIGSGPSKVYCGMNYTGSSCEDIYNNNPETSDKSGYYHVNDNQWTYCNMTAIAAGLIPMCGEIGG